MSVMETQVRTSQMIKGIKKGNNYLHISSPGHTNWRDKCACLNRALTNRVHDGLPLLFPGFEGLEQLDDLIPLALFDIVDAYATHLDVVVQEEVEEFK